MPTRLIRDEILDSERLQSLPIEARWFFVSVMLSADDLGLFECSEFKMARKSCLDQKIIPALIQLLADADLIRLYTADGKRFGFIPRFRQRVQIKRIKFPPPPAALMVDDVDASNKINELQGKQPLDNSEKPLRSVAQPSEPEPEPEVKRDSSAELTCPYQKVVDSYHNALPDLPRVRLMGASRKRAIKKLWCWVMSSAKSDGSRRATNEAEALEWLGEYFARASANDFLMGRLARSGEHSNWQCDLDFLLTEKGLRHVIEKTREAA